MGGEDQRVEAPRRGLAVELEEDSVRSAPHRLDGTGEVDAIGEGTDNGLDVLSTASANGPPLGGACECEQSVVGEEAQEGVSREVADLPRGRRPDGASHGQEEVTDEVSAIAAAAQERAESDGAVDLTREERPPVASESHDVDHEPKLTRTQKLGRMREDPPRPPGGVLEATAATGDAKRHVALLSRNAELVEQAAECGVGDGIVDEEARVHRQLSPVESDRLRVG